MKDVTRGDILAADIIHEDTMLIKKGTKLTDAMINLLKKEQIEAIKILENGRHSEMLSSQDLMLHSGSSVSKQSREEQARNTFFHALSTVGHEHRYGKILNKDRDLQQIMQLFTDMHVNHNFIDILYTLKKRDHYTFIHSFDVFILGTLLAKRQGIHHFDDIALGYLFHDIGKIEIPQDVLNKKGKLTFSEFSLIQKHTIKGEDILNSLQQNHIAHYARSHHERIDGSGYPDKLLDKDLSIAMKILQIVDVYSALTLKRAYKDALPAQVALRILMEDVKKYDKDILYDFIEALSIYPEDAIVLLSDHTTAIIKQVDNQAPILPNVKRIDQELAVTLPLNLSLTIAKMIDFQSTSFRSRFEMFLNDLMKGDQNACSDRFAQLIDGLQLEDIYTKIFLPAYWELQNNPPAYVKLPRCQTILINLLEQLEREMKALNNYHFKTAIVIDQNYHDPVAVQIMLGLLHVENIFPVVIHSPISEKNLIKLVANNEIESICIISVEDSFADKYPVLETMNLRLSDISSNALAEIFKEITDVTDESIHFYDRLFNCKEKA